MCLPLTLLVWLGGRIARHERTALRQQLRELLTEQLKETDHVVSRYFQQREQEFQVLTELSDFDADLLRRIVRQHPQLSQLFVLEPDGRLRHPDESKPLNQGELEFLSRAKLFLADKDLIRAADSQGEISSQQQLTSARGQTLSLLEQTAAANHGWYVWYWGRGLNLIFWRRVSSGQVIGVELERSRWISDLIAELPATAFGETPEALSRVLLVDSNDTPIYEWGALEPVELAQPLVELPLSPPLTSWRWKYYLAERDFTAVVGQSTYLNLIAGLTVVGLGLLGLGVYFYRESARELREAATRVNFVNQVSHELKTPLTNIRMYAELLERDLQALAPSVNSGARRRLAVIVAESGRLSRLIGNVLTFARQQRSQLTLNLSARQVDEVIVDVLESFQPALQQRGIEVQRRLAAQGKVMLDRDLLEQILVNLFSNLEKHAAASKQVVVASRQSADRSWIVVSDQGPGIPARNRSKVFQPFFRENGRLEGAAGAGIGLSIARGLARLHGGDVVLLDSERGASFQVELRSPTADDPRTSTR